MKKEIGNETNSVKCVSCMFNFNNSIFIQGFDFFAVEWDSTCPSAIRFNIIVAVRGLIFRCAEDRVVRSLTTVAICSSDFFELFDSSKRRRKSITCAFSSLICIEQLRSF